MSGVLPKQVVDNQAPVYWRALWATGNALAKGTAQAVYHCSRKIPFLDAPGVITVGMINTTCEKPLIDERLIKTAAQERQEREIVDLKARFGTTSVIPRFCSTSAAYGHAFIQRMIGERYGPKSIKNSSRVMQCAYGILRKQAEKSCTHASVNAVLNMEHLLLHFCQKLDDFFRTYPSSQWAEIAMQSLGRSLAHQKEINQFLKDSKLENASAEEQFIAIVEWYKLNRNLPPGIPREGLTPENLHIELDKAFNKYLENRVDQLLELLVPELTKSGTSGLFYKYLGGQKILRDLLVYLFHQFGFRQIVDPHCLAQAILKSLGEETTDSDLTGFGRGQKQKVVETGEKMIQAILNALKKVEAAPATKPKDAVREDVERQKKEALQPPNSTPAPAEHKTPSAPTPEVTREPPAGDQGSAEKIHEQMALIMQSGLHREDRPRRKNNASVEEPPPAQTLAQVAQLLQASGPQEKKKDASGGVPTPAQVAQPSPATETAEKKKEGAPTKSQSDMSHLPAQVAAIFERSGLKMSPLGFEALMQKKETKERLQKCLSDLIYNMIKSDTEYKHTDDFMTHARKSISQIPILGPVATGFDFLIRSGVYTFDYFNRDSSKETEVYTVHMAKHLIGRQLTDYVAERIVSLVYLSWRIPVLNLIEDVLTAMKTPIRPGQPQLPLQEKLNQEGRDKIADFVFNHFASSGIPAQFKQPLSEKYIAPFFQNLMPKDGSFLEKALNPLQPTMKELLLQTRILVAIRKMGIEFEGDYKFWQCFVQESLNQIVADYVWANSPKDNPFSLSKIAEVREQHVELFLQMKEDELWTILAQLPEYHEIKQWTNVPRAAEEGFCLLDEAKTPAK